MWHEWYDWHAKRWTSMKYNPGICMKYMINYMINDMRNDMTKWYDMKEDTSGVILNDNENGKMVGPRILLYAHALGDTLYHSRCMDTYATR